MGRTITLDDDVAEKLEVEAAREGVSLDQVVNEALRSEIKPRKRFEVRPLDAGTPLLDLHCVGRVLDELDEFDRVTGRR